MKIYVMKKLYMASIYGLVTETKKNLQQLLWKNRYKSLFTAVFTHKTAVISDVYIDFLVKKCYK
jgi:hypothetical protein